MNTNGTLSHSTSPDKKRDEGFKFTSSHNDRDGGM